MAKTACRSPSPVWRHSKIADAPSACAIGLELDAISTMMGMRNKDTTRVTAVYVDALTALNVAARDLDDHNLVNRR